MWINSNEIPSSFPHLWKTPPNIKAIMGIDINNIKNEHLWNLDEHLRELWLKYSLVREEVNKIRHKIQIVMWLAPNICWEVMSAANNEEYKYLDAA
jgi:hypothetical protein